MIVRREIGLFTLRKSKELHRSCKRSMELHKFGKCRQYLNMPDRYICEYECIIGKPYIHTYIHTYVNVQHAYSPFTLLGSH